jgi:hypothetical protein
MKLTNYIPKNFLQSGYIAALPQLHDALRFCYRPAVVLERAELRAAAAADPPGALERCAAAMLLSKIACWDYHGPDGPILPITRENLLEMHGEVFCKLYQIVFGMRPSDIDPAWPPEKVAEQASDERLAAAAACSIGEIREEYHEKNLPGG